MVFAIPHFYRCQNLYYSVHAIQNYTIKLYVEIKKITFEL